MSEAGIDMERCMQGVNDEEAWRPEITWTNCSEKMPPDDDSLIIVKISYIKPGVDYVCVGLISNYLAITSKAFLDMLGRYDKAVVVSTISMIASWILVAVYYGYAVLGG